jgi:hypothetical protein
MLDDDTLARLMAEDAKRCNARMIGANQGRSANGKVGGNLRAEQIAAETERLHGRILAALSDGQEYTIYDIRQSLAEDGQGGRSESATRQAVNILIGQGAIEMASEGIKGRTGATFRGVR